MTLNQFPKKKEKSKIKNLILRILFSHLGLFIIVSLYAVFGAYVFISLEKPEEEKRIIIKKNGHDLLQAGKKYIVAQAWYLSFPKTPELKFKAEMRQNLQLFRKTLIQKMKEEHYDGERNRWTYDWSMSNSLLFTVSTIGAIGYGNIHPKTWLGQLFTIYYGMIGIPLLLLFLANIGELMATVMRYVYSRFCCRWCRARRRLADFRDNKKNLQTRALMQDEVGMETYMPTKQIPVPIMVNLAVIATYLACGGVFFTYSEPWQLYESCYFCFITLTTIGFGDYVPGESTNTESALKSFQFLITIFYSIFGMALLSMSINLMKTQIVQNSKWLAYEIGIVEEDYDPMERYNVKRACEDNMIVTPPGKDGNKCNVLYNAEDDFTLPRGQQLP